MSLFTINAGAQVDLSFMDEFEHQALLLIVQPGMEGGNAVADIISGKNGNPSGKLADTWAYEYEDYPNSEKFHNNGNVQTGELYEKREFM